MGVHGRMYVPHFLKEFKPIGPIGNDREEVIWTPREGFGFQHPEPKIIEMTDEQNALILKGMWGVVNNGGTAGSVKMANLEIAGKTGTAQNSELGSGGAKDHAWFVSFAPAYKPEIAVLAMIENSGFGAANAGPAAKGIYEAYLLKKGIGPATDNQQVQKDSYR
jgi:cell division protein FtsI/penicillin-binding protein 2